MRGLWWPSLVRCFVIALFASRWNLAGALEEGSGAGVPNEPPASQPPASQAGADSNPASSVVDASKDHFQDVDTFLHVFGNMELGQDAVGVKVEPPAESGAMDEYAPDNDLEDPGDITADGTEEFRSDEKGELSLSCPPGYVITVVTARATCEGVAHEITAKVWEACANSNVCFLDAGAIQQCPVEPTLRVSRTCVKGEPQAANQLTPHSAGVQLPALQLGHAR
ncbi:thrombospondin, type I repeat containing protein [Babesia caballi]|uniref:Thrombospondin, type I repeat containing protein n=1 Tax=Babesia caballi TaxID=5871 RepID=A0AAV4LV55_BABCB|nr:thrombospondin, type I repeat containing protein [Babesia caballi]